MATTFDLWLDYFRNLPWDQAKSLFELTVWLLAIFAVFGCLIRLGTIRSIIKDFLEARGPIWDLRNMVNDLKAMEPVIKQLQSEVPLIIDKLETMRLQMEALREQANEFQLESMSTRIEAADEAPAVSFAEPEAKAIGPDEENWRQLRDYWKRNSKRLEFVISNIDDGRKRGVYDRMPRTNLDRIVNKLQGQKVISAAAANASRSLNEVFNSYRPRNRSVPDEVVGGVRVLDQQLEKELAQYKVAVQGEEYDTTVPGAASIPPFIAHQTSNGFLHDSRKSK